MRTKYTSHGKFSRPIVTICGWLLLFTTACSKLTRYGMQRSGSSQSASINQKETNPSSTGLPPLHSAASRGHVEVIKALLEKPGIQVNEKDVYSCTPLHWASQHGHVEVVKELLKAPGILVSETNEYGATPLHLAAMMNNLEIVRMLLEAGINVNEKNNQGFTATQLAAQWGHVKVIELIVNHIKRVGVSGGHQASNSKVNDLNNQLLVAAENGDLAKIKELLKQPGIDVNCKDQHARTPLHLAVIKVHSEVAEVLVTDSRVDVNAKDRDGRSPLYFATHYDYDYETESNEKLHEKVTMYEILSLNPGIDISEEIDKGQF